MIGNLCNSNWQQQQQKPSLQYTQSSNARSVPGLKLCCKCALMRFCKEAEEDVHTAIKNSAGVKETIGTTILSNVDSTHIGNA